MDETTDGVWTRNMGEFDFLGLGASFYWAPAFIGRQREFGELAGRFWGALGPSHGA